VIALVPSALLVLASLAGGPAAGEPLRVFLRAGPKTHGPGQHDHPRFLEEWTKLLSERGCTVRGALAFPGEEDLSASDVLVLYAAEGASIHGEERARLERFLGRGGGLVVLHDAVCGDDPLWFQTVAGGAWEHGRAQYQEGELGLCFADREHPITRGVANFDLDDEIYWNLHLDPGAHVLANAFHTPFDVTPQMWTFEKAGYRAFVSIQGHNATSFTQPAWRTLLLRGIAWAGKHEADELVTAAEVADLAYPPGGPLRPEQAASALRLHPDFELALVAAEPLVVNPISLDWDPAGRMWVALTPGYPEKQEFSGLPAHDSVVVLSDADGDGRMDGKRVFADGLDLVTSLVFHRDGVIVTQAPEILFLRDTDGDGAADQRQVLFRGFGYGDTHAVISNLRRGLDGWIYGTQGYSGNDSRHVVGADGVDHGHIGNGVFRFRPDGSAIEPVLSYGSNTWGLDFSWDGELFFTMANGSHLRHEVLADRELAGGRIGSIESWRDVCDHDRVFPLRDHERAPYQQIDFVGGFTAASGSCLYTGGVWPREYEGDHFVCEPTVNLVHHDSLEPQGVSFHASKARAPEFLASTDLWFRPVHLRVGPDGALYLLDFYNQAAVHNDTRGPPHGRTNAALRPDRDHEHGRIWRIQHRAAPRDPFVPLGTSDRELVNELGSPSLWRRMSAQRLLEERPPTPATMELCMARAVNSTRPYSRVHALWILAHGDRERFLRVADALARDPDAGVRKNLLHALGTLSDWDVARAVPATEDLLRERDPRALLAGLVLLKGRLAPADHAALLARYQELEDDWSRSAVLQIALATPARLLESALAAPAPASMRVTELFRAMATELARRGDLEHVTELVRSLGERAAPQPALAAAVLGALARLDGELKPWSSPRLDDALVRLARSDDTAVALAVLPLCESWGQGRQVAAARDELGQRLGGIVADAGAPLELRLSALEGMLGLSGQRAAALELAPTFLDPLFAPDVQARVIDALAGSGDPGVAATLCASFQRLSQPARERIFARLIERADWSGVLLDALEREELRAAELGPQRLHRLRRHPDAAVAARANELLDRQGQGERTDKEALLSELVPLVDRPGDRAHGRELFAHNCGTCHTAQGVETRGGVGPDLTGMGAHGARELLPFLIDPNRSVEPAYLEYVVETTDGKLVDGVITRESADTIVLRNSSGEAEVARDHVADLRSTGRSPMPVGFESLGAEALRDIVAFLAGDYADYRVIDLRPVVDASATRGLYDTKNDARPMRFRRHGVVDVEGVPFELLDPARMEGERNALVLKGGMREGWESKGYPQRVELELGYALVRLHVLGGIAAWGHPFTDSRSPIVKLTWKYADGASEEQVLVDGDQFADWIGRHEVPGSKWVDLLTDDSWGQVRTFTLAPARTDAVVASLVLESFDNHLAPTFLALTAQLAGAAPAEPAAAARPVPQVLVFGGGSSHDFARWFQAEDGKTLAELGKVVGYSEDPAELGRALPSLEALVLCNNQPLADAGLRTALLAYVEGGGGLVLVHPATWYNWADWPEYNRALVGGGARGHEEYREFAVRVGAAHALTEGVPRSFSVTDELYRLELDPAATPSDVLATGKSLVTGAEFPVLWTRSLGKGRIVGLTLGHDGAAHEHAAYRTLLVNAARWVGR